MTIADFISRIEEEFEDLKPGQLQPDSDFRQVIDWNSICALLMISLIDTEYDVTISADELRKSLTVAQLFEVVSAKTEN